MKGATVNVRVTPEQAQRWQAAAQYEGARTVGTWLASLAAERLRKLGRYVPRMPLVWRRARFRILNGEAPNRREVAGIVAGPFGIHKEGERYTLSHVPTGSHFATLQKQRRCKFLARELATFRLDWNASEQAAVTGPDLAKAWDAIHAARRAADPHAYPSPGF